MVRINFLPIFIAILEPKKPPATEQSIQGIAMGKRILPFKSHVAMEAILEEKFNTLVVPTAFIKSRWTRAERARVINIPVPGPKKPS